MRAAPPCQVSLRRFGVWQAAMLTLAVLGGATIAAWSMSRESPPDSLASIAVALAAAVLCVLGASLARVPVADLRWDGRTWQLGPASGDPLPGHLSVAIDLGPWMLLRFAPAVREGARSCTTWLPAQRSGLESQWHALRCAVYSPRPPPAEDRSTGF